MTTDHFDRLKALFDEASELPVDDRDAFVVDRCGDDVALRDELRRLLAHDERPLDVFEAPPRIDPEEDVSLDGVAVPGYAISHEIGRGGFGVVYKAQQLQPVRRPVALKLITYGFASATIKQRFAIECDALARLDHPSIARVFDAGTTPSGYLFCTMELIDGVSICDYANNHRLSARERIELLLPVCEAIQHAHQRGILHRDLKPSNILVAELAGKPLPKVIDFGIAKVRNDEDPAAAELTLSGEFVGTPVYMSPEQADPDRGGVDTRSDVYSLAVVLYELLTSTAPLQTGSSSSPSLETVLRTLREDDAPLASRRLRDLGDDARLHAERCGTNSDALIRGLTGDLDRVLAMALERDRSRRYESPQQFAADLGRLLRNEAVVAQSPTASYLLRKFARRHRGKLVLGATAVVLLVLGTIGTVIGLVNAVKAQEEEARQRAVAEREARISGEIVAFLNEDLLASVSPEAMGIDVSVREVLDTASENIEGRFGGLPDVEVALRTTLGATYRALGVIKPSLSHLEKACALAERHLEPDDPRRLRAAREHGAALYTAGSYERSATLLHDVLERYERVFGEGHEDTIATAFHLASAHSENPDQSKSRALLKRWLPISRAHLGPSHVQTLQFSFGHGHVLLAERDKKGALAIFEEAFDRARTALGGTHRLTLMLMNEIGRGRVRLGQAAKAESLFRSGWKEAAARLGQRHPTTLNLRLGLVSALVRDPKRFDEVAALLEGLLQAWPKAVPAAHPNLLGFWYTAAGAFSRIGQPERARNLLESIVQAKEDVPDRLVLSAMRKLKAIADRAGAKAASRAWQERYDKAAARVKRGH